MFFHCPILARRHVDLLLIESEDCIRPKGKKTRDVSVVGIFDQAAHCQFPKLPFDG